MASNEKSKLISGAFQAQYILCITEDVSSEFRIEEYNWIRAAEFSDSLGVDIINSSLGYNIFDDPEMNYSKEDLDGKTAVITIGASMAAYKGILVISSAGNEGNGNWETLTAPADAAGTIAVGSVTNGLIKSSFSSTGPTFDGRLKPDLVAFGSGVTLWRKVEGPTTSSGTSFTSPQIAALAAGLWEARPEWTREQIIQNLLNSGTMAEAPNMEVGFGIPNFLDAYYGEILDLEEYKESELAVVYPNPLDGNQLFVEFGKENQCSFRMTNARGQVVSDLILSRNSPRLPYQIKIENASPGLYFLECRENKEIQAFRLLKR
jgi:subtilisin family serine protease